MIPYNTESMIPSVEIHQDMEKLLVQCHLLHDNRQTLFKLLTLTILIHAC